MPPLFQSQIPTSYSLQSRPPKASVSDDRSCPPFRRNGLLKQSRRLPGAQEGRLQVADAKRVHVEWNPVIERLLLLA